MNHSMLFFTVIIISLLHQASLTELKPDMVIEIFRHGARAPSTLKYDPTWLFQGELTSTGMRQQYILGTLLAQKYSHLLNEYSPHKILIRSSNFNRTIMSASAQLFGAFEGKGPKFSTRSEKYLGLPPFDNTLVLDQLHASIENVSTSIPTGFQPLATQIVNKKEDKVLFVGPWNCANMDIWQTERLKDDYNKQVFEYFKETIDQLQALGHNIKTLTDLHNFGDTLIDNHYENKTMPKGIEYGGPLYNDLAFIFKWYSIYNYIGRGLERILKTLQLLHQIVDWFEGVKNGTNFLKFAFLSAHDTTLLPLLGLYNITSDSCLFENYKSQKLGLDVPYPDCVYPEFASQIIYEFYNKSEGPYIKFFYNGKPFKICGNGNGFECSLADFKKESYDLLQNISAQEYDRYCNIPVPQHQDSTKEDDPKGASNWSIFLILFQSLIIAILTYIVIYQRREMSRHQPDQYNSYNEKFSDKQMIELKSTRNFI